jgi:hypothetical protein
MLCFVPFVLLLFVAANAAANDVAIEVKGGTLVVKGDADDNVLTLDQAGLGAASVRVTPGGSTTVNGSDAVHVFGALISGAKITLAGGADVLTLQDLVLNGTVGIKTGDGSDVVSASATTVHGAVKIDLGAGNNALELCGTNVDADATLKIGKQTTGLASATCAGSPDNVTTTAGSVYLMLNSSFGGALSVKAAAAVHVGVIDTVALTGPLAIKNVALAGVCYSGLGAGVSVKLPKIVGASGGEVHCEGGATEAFADGNTALAMSGVSMNGALTVKSSAGGDSVVVTGTNVQDAMTASLAAGNNFLFLGGVQVGTNLVAKAGKGDDQLQADALTIGDDTTVKYGAGNNLVDLGNALIGGNLTVSTGGGNDTIGTGAATVGGTKTIKNGKGVDTVS